MISQKTRSSLTVTIGTILIVIGTFLLVAFASGYNIDFLKGEIVTTGLALLNTNPGGATIKVSGRTLTQKTPYRLEGLKTGTITVEYSKPDYHDWKTSFFVKASQVTFADYALLIPIQIQTKQIDQQLSFTSIANNSEANKVFVFGSLPVSILEIKNDGQLRKIADIPTDVSLKQATSIQLLEVNPEGSALVVKATYENSNSIVFWVNTSNGELVNLTDFVSMIIDSPRINPRNNREIFAISEGKIRRINVESRTVTTGGINNVTSYNIDADNLYTLENLTPSDSGQFLIRYDLAGNNRYVMAQYGPSKTPWGIGLSKLHGQSNISLLNPDSGTLHIVRYVDGKILTSEIGNNITIPKFSRNGRFISYVQGDTFKTIDLEFAERFSTTQENTLGISWFSDFQLLITKPDGLYIVDYTGENLVKVPPNTSTTDSLSTGIDKNGKHIYYLDRSKLHTYSLEPKGGLINFR